MVKKEWLFKKLILDCAKEIKGDKNGTKN